MGNLAIGIDRNHRVAKGGQGRMKLRTAAFSWQPVNFTNARYAGNLFERMGQQRKPFRTNGGDVGIDVMGGDLKGADIEPLIGQHIDHITGNTKPVFALNFKPHNCTDKFTL